VDIPTDAKATMDTAIDDWCFLCCPCRDIISKTVSEVLVSEEFVGELVRELENCCSSDLVSCCC
jgi:hypothetical protein